MSLKRVCVTMLVLGSTAAVLAVAAAQAAEEDGAPQTGAAPPSCAELARQVARAGRATLDGVLFDFDRASLRDESLATLAGARDLIVALGGTWRVEGHTDNVGTADYNLRLSRERATAVAGWLAAAGVPAGQLRADGFGFDRPVADNVTDEGRARNRRVDLVAVEGSVTAAANPPEGCSSAASVADGSLPPPSDFGRVSGAVWLPSAQILATGRTAGASGEALENMTLPLDGTPQMCQQMCLTASGCAAWAFEPAGSYFIAEPRCHRFAYDAELRIERNDPTFVAGVKPDATVLAEGQDVVVAQILAEHRNAIP